MSYQYFLHGSLWNCIPFLSEFSFESKAKELAHSLNNHLQTIIIRSSCGVQIIPNHTWFCGVLTEIRENPKLLSWIYKWHLNLCLAIFSKILTRIRHCENLWWHSLYPKGAIFALQCLFIIVTFYKTLQIMIQITRAVGIMYAALKPIPKIQAKARAMYMYFILKWVLCHIG